MSKELYITMTGTLQVKFKQFCKQYTILVWAAVAVYTLGKLPRECTDFIDHE